MSLFCLSGCVFIGFNKGPYHDKSVKFDQYTINGNIVFKINESIEVSFQNFQCGYYGLLGVFIVPFIPYWANSDCSNLIVMANKSIDHIYIRHNDYIYSPKNPSSKFYYYKFPIPTNSLSEGAILVAEQDEEIFEIPFRYQHSFELQWWGT
jgi:hypothetical protein